MLHNKMYCGFVRSGGAGSRLTAKEAFNRIGATEVAGGCPTPIVSLADWERVQRKLEKNREEKRKVRPSSSSPLSGCLVCGHCGARMPFNRRGVFICESHVKRPSAGCRMWCVREAKILPLVVGELVKTIDRHLLETYQSKPCLEASPLESLKARLEVLKRET